MARLFHWNASRAPAQALPCLALKCESSLVLPTTFLLLPSVLPTLQPCPVPLQAPGLPTDFPGALLRNLKDTETEQGTKSPTHLLSSWRPPSGAVITPFLNLSINFHIHFNTASTK